MSRAVVLLSGGQDSTTCLFWAKKNYDAVLAVSIDYGQLHVAEIAAARSIASIAKVPLHAHSMQALGKIGGSALVDPSQELRASGGLHDDKAPGGLPTSFVPGRNLLMLSLAAAAAVKFGAKTLVTGVCQTDYSGYPDCRREFIDSLEKTITLAMPSSSGPFDIVTPLMRLTKRETVILAKSLGDDCWEALGLSLTCYHGRRPACGDCPACRLRAKGFEEAGLADPALA